MEDENSNVSQNAGDSEEVQYEEMGNIREMFGLPEKIEAKADEESDDPVKDETPAIEDVKTESNKRIVKFNKEDREVDESEVDELLQKGLGLDKVREQKNELEKTLDRVAKLAGFDNHSDYVANLDKLEQQQLQDKQKEQDTLRDDLLYQLELNGVDRAQAEAFIDNHPLVKQGKEAIETIQKANNQSEINRRWQPLYEAYPDLREDSQAFSRGETPAFFTPEMQALVAKGNDPLLAYEHLNKDKVTTQKTKAAEQKAIKDLQLGNRSQVETIDRGTQESQASEELRGVFSMFGIDPKRAQKYAK